MTLLQTGKQTLVEQMLLIRAVEDRLQTLCLDGLAGDLHFSKGQEAISVGVCAALRSTDYVVTHHRSIAHAIARGVPMEAMLAEVLGKSTGMNGGFAGEMHMSYPEKRFMFSWQLVGTCVPVAAGIAWAAKNYLKSDDIVVVFHGDAATANGQWHEGVNLAAVQHLPLLLVCENNYLAGNVRPEHYLPEHGSCLAHRAVGFDLFFEEVDGNDVQAVQSIAGEAASYVRRRSKPFFLVCNTTRLGRHKQGQGDLRSKAELATLALRDPLRDVQPEERVRVENRVNTIVQSLLKEPDVIYIQGRNC